MAPKFLRKNQDMNIARVLAATLTVFATLPGARTAWADARVQVESQAPLIRITAEVDTGVNRDVAWDVLTDYNRWAEFIPDLIVCRVISQPGEALRLEQRGRIPQLPNFPLVLITEVQESPRKGLRFQRIAGNIKTLAGEWQIKGKSNVQLSYQAIVEPGFPLPPHLTLDIFRNDAKVRLEALADEMARRAR
jgi:hypothetical protein